MVVQINISKIAPVVEQHSRIICTVQLRLCYIVTLTPLRLLELVPEANGADVPRYRFLQWLTHRTVTYG
jgi:hypothetical protein